jgi:hypothetical protein
MVKRDLADTLKYEGYIVRHDGVGRRRQAPFDEGKIMVTLDRDETGQPK